jgi:phosphopantothenoylcysteine decarboxylase/phosphopantothenate--cysteine ligase
LIDSRLNNTTYELKSKREVARDICLKLTELLKK